MKILLSRQMKLFNQMWIKSYYIEWFASTHEKTVIEMRDPTEIRALPESDKRIRKTFSDIVSDTPRRIKKKLYL
jgi:hypothetical protein